MESKFHSVKNCTRQERPKVKWMEAAYFVDGQEKGTLEQEQAPTGDGQPAPAPAPVAAPPSPRVTPAGDCHQSVRRSIRQRQQPERVIEVMTAELANLDIPFELFEMETMFPNAVEPHDFLAMKASTDLDTMYLHQAMKQPDRKEFQKAMKEMINQMDQKVIERIQKKDLPKGATLLPAVWQMKRKRNIKTGKVKKWKAWLNIDGSRMVKHCNYDLTYAPVASWGIIKLLLALALTLGWHTVQLDYVLAFTQSPVERELYMQIPKGIDLDGADLADYCFKVRRNTCGQKQAGRV
ncbi:unnamed protein product [Cylindrotheca closterium]|uniref:Reverse transcriptase Ty1/copia-type domain-containing protein n=1 Tax=Cylindrotheca closterium TaxID=2856 RepID=A0AAD2G2Q7_9STRA|nr:unnamed protein product [Cylindrotheca closterium]